MLICLFAVSTVSAVNFTVDEIVNTSGTVKTYVEANNKLPTNTKVGNTTITIPQYLELSTKATLNINNSLTGGITLKNGISNPSGPSETMKGGLINSTEYLDIANRVNNYIANNGIAPNYASSSLGNIRHESLVYMYSKILYSYDLEGKLPNFITVDSWSTVSSSSTKFYYRAEVKNASTRVKNYIQNNKQLPTSVVIRGNDVSMPSFLKILTTTTLQIQGGYFSSVASKSYQPASNPAETIKGKNIAHGEYIEIASNVYTFMNTMGYAPNYATTSFGNMRYESLFMLILI